MKDRLSIDKIMHVLVHNSFLVTVIVMCFVHAGLLGIMLYGGVRPLVYFNIVSVIIYFFCILLCRVGHIMPVYVSILLEVSIYSSVSVRFVGWESGGWCFLFSIVPIILYFGCFLFKGNKRWILVLLLTLNFATYVVLYLRFAEMPPLIEMAPLVRTVLFLFSSFVMIFSVIFYNTMYIYASEVERKSLEQKNEKLSVDALEDALTGLWNRRGFLPVVKQQMEGKRGASFCVAFCDIDNFKRINDSYGHDGGDEVLRHISGMIKKEMAGCDICRWGGEEIVILMKDYGFEEARQKTEALRKSIESNQTIFFNKHIPATITIGLECYKEEYNEPEEIIKKADDRMYYGKQHGKNIVIYEDSEER